MPFRKRQFMCLALVVVAVAATIVFGVIYCGISESLTAERSLHANLLVVDLLREYVVSHKGAWPGSWEDLEEVPGRRRAMFQWPEDKENVRHYVLVDFAADPDKLAKQSVEQFVAVQPRGPCYSYDAEVAQLLDAIRESRHGDVGTAPP